LEPLFKVLLTRPTANSPAATTVFTPLPKILRYHYLVKWLINFSYFVLFTVEDKINKV